MAHEDQPVGLARAQELVAAGKARAIRLRAHRSYPETGRALGTSHVSAVRREEGDRGLTGNTALCCFRLLERLDAQLTVVVR